MESCKLRYFNSFEFFDYRGYSFDSPNQRYCVQRRGRRMASKLGNLGNRFVPSAAGFPKAYVIVRIHSMNNNLVDSEKR